MTLTRSPFMQSRTDGGVGPLVLSNPATFGAGNVYFVQSTNANAGDTAGKGQTPDAPFATLDYAVSQCTASQGDVIIVLPGHAEVVSATALCEIDIAGVKVIGVGQGTLKPTFTLSTSTAAIVTISGANCWLENVRIASNLDNIAKGITITASGVTLKNVELVDGASNKEMLIHINIATGCDDITLDGVRVLGLGGGATAGIKFAGTCNNFRMVNCEMNGTWSASAIDASAGILLKQALIGNFVCNEDTGAGLCYKGNASSTGFIVNCAMMGTKNNTETIATVTAMHCSGNLGTDTVATAAIAVPATATAWS